MTSASLGKPALLGVFAHPDDEQFGTAGALLNCLEQGVAIHLLLATRGEAGEISDPILATPETLGTVREQEMREVCHLLGFESPVFLDHPDGKLADVEPEKLIREVASEIRRIRPQVVLTFDANGAYGHPDHIAIHCATVAAFDAAADPRFAPDLGPPHQAAKLYATAYPRSLLASLNEALVTSGFPALDFGSVQTIRPDAIGTEDARVTTVVPVEHFFDRRSTSLATHRTQYGPHHPFRVMPDETMRALSTSDVFVRLRPLPAPGAALPDEDDLWAGLPRPQMPTTHRA